MGEFALINTTDRVAYSRTFLRATGQVEGDALFVRGVVTRIVGDRAEVEWDLPNFPRSAPIRNLIKVRVATRHDEQSRLQEGQGPWSRRLRATGDDILPIEPAERDDSEWVGD